MNWNKVWTIARHEFITNVRRRGFIFFTLLVPALELGVVIILAYFSGPASTFFQSQLAPTTDKVGVIDQSGIFTPLPPNAGERFVSFDDTATARRALAANQVTAFVVIAADYLESGKITSYSRTSMGGVTGVDSNSLRALLVSGLLAGKVDAAIAARASRPINLTTITLDASGNAPTSAGAPNLVAGFLAPFFLSMFLAVSIFVSSGYLLRSVSEEKESRVIEIILSSVSATELLSGKVIGLGACGLLQVGVWLASTFALSGGTGSLIAGAAIVQNPSALLFAAVYTALGYMLFAIIMASVGALGTNLRESQQMAGLFSFSATLPYMLSGLLFSNPNAGIARVLSFFPLTAPAMMTLRIPLGPVPLEDIIGSIGVLVVTIPFVMWLGARVFRMGLLMYGKRPTLKEIARYVREA
ncbi:MAG: ABC transporter permease [Chloroflexi bacterium]|nr:ABC transporter permease [Chloroflexota bacterium]